MNRLNPTTFEAAWRWSSYVSLAACAFVTYVAVRCIVDGVYVWAVVLFVLVIGNLALIQHNLRAERRLREDRIEPKG